MSISLKAMLPVGSAGERSSHPDRADVYNLIVLVRNVKDSGTVARAANLPLAEVCSPTVREALAALVANARELIAECVSRQEGVPWVEPAREADDCESRFMVPIHL